MSPTQITLPDFIASCPFPLNVNPHYMPLARISEDWLASKGVHPNAAHRVGFQKCNFGLLTAMCYPTANPARLRILLDFIFCLFAFDDLTDEGHLKKDESGTKTASDILMDALRYPETLRTDFKVGETIRDFWSRALLVGCAPGTQRRFIEYTDLYVQAVHQQVLKRAGGEVPSIQEFIELRRDTGALKMCFAMGEFGLGVDLPDEVFENPFIKTMEECANDVVVLSNDIYSYNVEQMQGEKVNIISVSMREKSIDVQAAMDYAGELVNDCMARYLEAKAQLPSWGPSVDTAVLEYCGVMEAWCSGGFHWSLTSERYFGANVKQVRETLRVELSPVEEDESPQIRNLVQPVEHWWTPLERFSRVVLSIF